MQKLTLSIDDDLYAMLHQQVGRGSIGRFICDAVRPHLQSAASQASTSAFGLLSHRAKSVTASEAAKAKRDYMVKRYAAKNGTQASEVA
jgi:hypothetical protein